MLFNVLSFVIGTAIGVAGLVYGHISAKRAIALATEDDDVRWEITWPAGDACIIFGNAGERDTAFGVVIDVRVGMDGVDEHRRVVVGTPLPPGRGFRIYLPETRLRMAALSAAGEELSGAHDYRIEWRTRLGNRRTAEDAKMYLTIAPLSE